jgi:hypothetical protein
MLYLGIDQHRKQLTVCVLDEQGEIVLRRQVSTQWERVREFFADLRTKAGPAGFAAILEVCGFNDWLLAMLAEYGCRETVLIQVESRSNRKTDRRDAHALAELLWINRERLAHGQRMPGMRRIQLPTPREAEERQLTELRKRMGQSRSVWARSPSKVASPRGSSSGSWCCTCCARTRRCGSGTEGSRSGAGRRSPGWR